MIKRNLLKCVLPLMALNVYATDDIKKIFIPAEKWTLIGVNNCGPNKIKPGNEPFADNESVTILKENTHVFRDPSNEYGKYFHVDNQTNTAVTFYIKDTITGNDSHLIPHNIQYTDETDTTHTITIKYDEALSGTKIKIQFTSNGTYYIDLPSKAEAPTDTAISSKFNTKDILAGTSQDIKTSANAIKYITVDNQTNTSVSLYTVDPIEGDIDSSYLPQSYYLQYDEADDASILKLTEYISMGGSITISINGEIYTFRYDQLSTNSVTPTQIKLSEVDDAGDPTPYGALLADNKTKNINESDTSIDIFDNKENKLLKLETPSSIGFELKYLNIVAQNMAKKYIKYTNAPADQQLIVVQYPSNIDTNTQDNLDVIVKGEKKSLQLSALSSDIDNPTEISTDTTNTIGLCSVENMIYTNLNNTSADTSLTDSYIIYNYEREDGQNIGTWKRHTMGTRFTSINDRNNFKDDEFAPGSSYWLYRTDSDTTDSTPATDDGSGVKVDKYSAIPDDYYKNLPSGWNMVSFDDMKLIEDFKIYSIKLDAGIGSDQTENSTFDITNSAITHKVTVNLKNNGDEVFAQINAAVTLNKGSGAIPNDVNIKAYKMKNGDTLIISDSSINIDNDVSLTSQDESEAYRYGLVLSTKPTNIILKDSDNKDIAIVEDSTVSGANNVIELDDGKTVVFADKRFALYTNTLTNLVDNDSSNNDTNHYSVYSVSSLAYDTQTALTKSLPISGFMAPQFTTDDNPFKNFTKDVKSIWAWSSGQVASNWKSTIFDQGKKATAENIESKSNGYDIMQVESTRGYWINLGDDLEATQLELTEEDITVEIQYEKVKALGSTLINNSIMHNSSYTSTISCKNVTDIKAFANMKIAFRLVGETAYGNSIDMIPDGDSTFKLKLYNDDILNKDSIKLTVYNYRGDSAYIEKDLTALLADPDIKTPTMDNIENIKYTSDNAQFISIYNGDIDIDNDLNSIDNIVTNRIGSPVAVEAGEYILSISALNKNFGDSVNIKAYTMMTDFAPTTKFSNIEELDDVYVLNKDSRLLEVESDNSKKMTTFDETGTKTVLDMVENTGISVTAFDYTDENGDTVYGRTAIIYKDNDVSRHDVNTPLSKDFKAGDRISTINYSKKREDEVVFIELNGKVYKIDNLKDQPANTAIDLEVQSQILNSGITSVNKPNRITLAAE